MYVCFCSRELPPFVVLVKQPLLPVQDMDGDSGGIDLELKVCSFKVEKLCAREHTARGRGLMVLVAVVCLFQVLQ